MNEIDPLFLDKVFENSPDGAYSWERLPNGKCVWHCLVDGKFKDKKARDVETQRSILWKDFEKQKESDLMKQNIMSGLKLFNLKLANI